MKQIFLIGICSLFLGFGFSCTDPSTYNPTHADHHLLSMIEPKIDAIFTQDHLRGNKLMIQIKDIGMRFEIDSREYYILRELHLYMNSKINETIVIPSFESGNTLESYMLYSDEAFNYAITQEKAVVINFRASWCPRCKATSEEIIAHRHEIPSGVVVLEADFDSTKELQKRLGVTMQTTFVFFDVNGEKIKNIDKLTGIDQLLKELE